MSILVTGAAGFIGSALSQALLARGNRVVGLDDFNDYYDPALKEARAARLTDQANFTMVRANLADQDAVFAAARQHGPFRRVVHLAAQAGVRYSLENPMAYVQTNLVGQMVILELCRQTEGFEHLVYASSSSVYGGNTKLPFAVEDRVDTPSSLYAATKRADELMGHSYSHLYRLPMTGLRYFTVYGPWGRPDMALFIFTKAIYEGRPIQIFNHGDMMRDFTYVDDIVDGTIRALDNPPPDTEQPPWRLYNIGNNRSEPLLRLIEILEETIGRQAERQLEPMQPGDVKETYADISAIQRDLGYAPKTPIDEGVPNFVAWYRDYHGL
ncbi:MAG: NAD-dependent epimerase/dehydratase family protein [Alphaproteobacteria bacterium]|jgi:UDP-glucuronate 4-epimerase|nr:NAD-dependent epimerase/dehydratase family protein [Alphaproteobacteria bacterium]HJP20818.1 NAD-dependent epimerase/dehydratase family protein [Alphaproteobacteria bacterium]